MMLDDVGMVWPLRPTKSLSGKRSKKSSSQIDSFCFGARGKQQEKNQSYDTFSSDEEENINFSFDSIDENSLYDVKNAVNERLEEKLMKSLKRKELAFNDTFQAFQVRKRSKIRNCCRGQHQIY